MIHCDISTHAYYLLCQYLFILLCFLSSTSLPFSLPCTKQCHSAIVQPLFFRAWEVFFFFGLLNQGCLNLNWFTGSFPHWSHFALESVFLSVRGPIILKPAHLSFWLSIASVCAPATMSMITEWHCKCQCHGVQDQQV